MIPSSKRILVALCACVASQANAQDTARNEKADPGVKLPQVLNIIQQHRTKLDQAKERGEQLSEKDPSGRAASSSTSLPLDGGQSAQGSSEPLMSSNVGGKSSPGPTSASVRIPVATAGANGSPSRPSIGRDTKPVEPNGSVASQPTIPVVPVAVVKANVPPSIDSKAARGAAPKEELSSSPAKDPVANDEPVLTMKPGVNQIIPIAINHPNRIVTPFASPEVVSTSLSSGKEGECGEICIKDNVVYVATDKQAPVTMFITNQGSEAQALSLTMLPRRVPPREVFLKLHAGASAMAVSAGQGNLKAQAWEKSQPYIETLRSAFRKLALNEIPQGYTMTQTPRELAALAPRCAQPGLPVDFSKGQYLAGHHINIYVGVATNTTDQPVEFKEAMCGAWEVAAVTSWPLKVLEPGQRTEVYVAVKQGARVPTTSQRPSLVGGR